MGLAGACFIGAFRSLYTSLATSDRCLDSLADSSYACLAASFCSCMAIALSNCLTSCSRSKVMIWRLVFLLKRREGDGEIAIERVSTWHGSDGSVSLWDTGNPSNIQEIKAQTVDLRGFTLLRIRPDSRQARGTRFPLANKLGRGEGDSRQVHPSVYCCRQVSHRRNLCRRMREETAEEALVFAEQSQRLFTTK